MERILTSAVVEIISDTQENAVITRRILHVDEMYING